MQGRSVLELGAGVGLPGYVARELGAERTRLTDNEAQLLPNLRHNARAAIAAHQATVALLDWSSDPLMLAKEHGKSWDVVLASDIVYSSGCVAGCTRSLRGPMCLAPCSRRQLHLLSKPPTAHCPFALPIPASAIQA